MSGDGASLGRWIRAGIVTADCPECDASICISVNGEPLGDAAEVEHNADGSHSIDLAEHLTEGYNDIRMKRGKDDG